MRGYLTVVAVGFMATAAAAAPGDLHRVTAELVNLRAGPSDETNVRTRVEGGDELLELRRDGNWLGVRVLETGEEGWIYGELVERVATSGLGEDEASAGFMELSANFDQVIRRINGQLGYPMITDVSQVDNETLRVTPSARWLRAGSRDAHLMAATAIYEMWKNHQNSAPVTVELLDTDGEPYITIDDGDNGPALAITDEAAPGSEG